MQLQSTSLCFYQLKHSRKDSKTKNEIKDKIVAFSTTANENFEKVYYDILEEIQECFNDKSIDKFEEVWLKNLADSEYINKCLDKLNYDAKPS